MCKYVFLISLWLCSLLSGRVLRAQEDGTMPGFGIEGNILAGKVIKHSSKFTAPIPSMSSAIDANFVWHTYGKKDWHQRCHFPVIGVGMTYTNYGNERVFGQCVGMYPNLQLPIYRNEQLEVTFRLGDGLGYVTRKYQASAPYDTLNTAIGTHLNDFAIFMLDLRLHIDQHWQAQVGGNFTHISNADYHQPNLGVNMAGWHLGVQYYPNTCKPKLIRKDLPKVSNLWFADMRMGISYKEARAAGNPILPTYMGSVYGGRHWHGKNKLYIGADYAYHNDVYAFLKNYGVDYGHEMSHAWDGAVFVGNEFLVGKLGLVTQIGVYYHQTFLKFDPVYEKIGGNYYFMKRGHGTLKEVFATAMLLTHGAVAELSEFGVGVGF